MLPDTSGCQSLPCFSLRALDTPEAKLGAECMASRSSAETLGRSHGFQGDDMACKRSVQMMPREAWAVPRGSQLRANGSLAQEAEAWRRKTRSRLAWLQTRDREPRWRSRGCLAGLEPLAPRARAVWPRGEGLVSLHFCVLARKMHAITRSVVRRTQ